MADEKPKDKAPERDIFVEVVSIIVILVILGSIASGIANYTNKDPLFRNGVNGLSQKNITLSYTRSVASLSNPIGANVLASKDSISVLNEAGGKVIGAQKFGSRGKITQGLIQVSGVSYYYVDFKNGTDGWVDESDIAYIEREPSFLAKILLFFWSLFSYIRYILLIISVLIIVALFLLVRRLTDLRLNNTEKLYPMLAVTSPKVSMNPKWERVLTHIESLNENDWRLAIIEADIMLAELLDTMRLVGDSIGEKLKGVEKSDFTTLDLAWEAHKIRNQIAHAGSDFRITQREALRVVELYREVFKEFQYI